MEVALIGLMGILIGILLNEYYRRNSRIENYSPQVFEKRLNIYEGLMAEVRNSASTITELVENIDLSVNEKKQTAFQVGLNITVYVNENQLYLNEEIAVHCCVIFVGIEDIFKEKTDIEAYKEFQNNIQESFKMIRKESGVEELDNLFNSITKSSPGGSIIEAYREIKKVKRGQI